MISTLALSIFLAPLPAKAPLVTPQATSNASTTDPAFEEVRRAFAAASRDHDDARLRASREGRVATVEHPARHFWPRMKAVSEGGSALATAWMLKNLRDAALDPASIAPTAIELFEKLTQTAAEKECMLDALSGLQALTKDIGVERVAALAESLAQTTKNHEVAARALSTQAAVISGGSSDKRGPAHEAAREIQRSILYLYPETQTAKSTTFLLLPEVQNELRAALEQWVSSVRAAQAAGKPETDWPKVPLHDFEPHFRPLAASGNAEAAKWTGTLYPSFEQASRVGLGHSLSWLVEQLGQYYPPRSIEWSRVRMGILSVACEQFPDAPWMRSALKSLLAQIDRLPARSGEGPANSVLSKSKDPSLRALALLIRAQSVRSGGDQASYESALADYQAILDKHPEEDPARLARAQIDELRAAMPGAPAPEMKLTDSDGVVVDLALQKGRVALVVFWQFMEPECAEVVPKVARLEEELAGKPFVVMGVNADIADKRTYTEQAQKLGWRWTSARANSIQNPALQAWQIRRWPTCVLVDAQGQIRARDLPWDQMSAMAKQLTGDAERAVAPR